MKNMRYLCGSYANPDRHLPEMTNLCITGISKVIKKKRVVSMTINIFDYNIFLMKLTDYFYCGEVGIEVIVRNAASIKFVK